MSVTVKITVAEPFGHHTQRHHRRDRECREPEGRDLRGERNRPVAERAFVAASGYSAGESRIARPLSAAAAQEAIRAIPTRNASHCSLHLPTMPP